MSSSFTAKQKCKEVCRRKFENKKKSRQEFFDHQLNFNQDRNQILGGDRGYPTHPFCSRTDEFYPPQFPRSPVMGHDEFFRPQGHPPFHSHYIDPLTGLPYVTPLNGRMGIPVPHMRSPLEADRLSAPGRSSRHTSLVNDLNGPNFNGGIPPRRGLEGFGGFSGGF